MPAVLLLKEFPDAYHHNYFYFFNGGLLRGMIGFAVGIASFLLYRQVTERKLSPWLSAALLAVLILLFFADKSAATNLLFMYALSFALMIVLALCPVSHGWFAAVLAFSGSISYSIYLLHVPVHLHAQRMLGAPHVPGAAAMWSLPLLMIAAPISAYFFEKPVQKKAGSFFSKKLADAPGFTQMKLPQGNLAPPKCGYESGLIRRCQAALPVVTALPLSRIFNRKVIR